MNQTLPFIQKFHGGLSGILRWPQLAQLWQTLRGNAGKHWFIYAVGEVPPAEHSSARQLDKFITEIDALLRKEHQEDYCGIVYVDDREDPSFIKIYDPSNLGVACGISDNPPLPGWVLSLQPPVDLHTAIAPTGQRRQWWQKLIGAAR